MLLRQFSVTFEYRPGSQHANVDDLSRQCGECLQLDCPVGLPDLYQFYLGPGGTTFCHVSNGHLDEATGDLPLPDCEPDLIGSSLTDKTMTIVREWVQAGAPPAWSDCAGLSPELRLWYLQFDNLSIDSDGLL